MDYLKGSLTFVPKNGQEKEIKYVPEKKSLIEIGSGISCDVGIRGDDIEVIHCKIYREADGKVKLQNCSESNPTLVNDEIVKLNKQLRSGDIVTVGNVKLRWELDADAKRRLTMMSKEDRKMYKSKIIKTNKRVTMHNFRINHIIKSSPVSSEESPNSDDGGENGSTVRIKEEMNSVDLQENNKIDMPIIKSSVKSEADPSVIFEKENEKTPSKTNILNLSGVLQTSYTPSSKIATRGVSKTPYNTPMRSPLVKSAAKSILNESVNVLSSSAKKPAKSMHLIDLTTPLVKRSETSTPKSSTLRNTPKTAGKTPLRNAILLKSALKNSSIKKPIHQNVSNLALKGKILFESPATDSSSVIEVSMSSIEVVDSSDASVSAKSFDIQSSDRNDVEKGENVLESPQKQTVPSSQSSDEVKELLDNITSVLSETENGNENVKETELSKEMTTSQEIEENFNKIVEQQSLEGQMNESLFDKILSYKTSEAVDNFDKFMSDENIIELPTKEKETDPDKKAEDLLKRIEVARESLATEPNKTTQILSTRYSNVTPNDSIVDSMANTSSQKYDVATPKISILDTVASLRKSELSNKLSMSPVSKMSVANDSTEIVENYELNSNIQKSLRSTRKRIGTAMASLHNVSQSSDTSFNVNESLNASINKDLLDANQSLAEMSNILSLDDQPTLESSNKENEYEEPEDLLGNKSTLFYEYSGSEENNGEHRVIFEINNENGEIDNDEEIISSSESDSEESDIEEQQEEMADSDENINDPVCESPVAKKFRLSEQDLEEEGINPLEISKGDEQLEMEVHEDNLENELVENQATKTNEQSENIEKDSNDDPEIFQVTQSFDSSVNSQATQINKIINALEDEEFPETQQFEEDIHDDSKMDEEPRINSDIVSSKSTLPLDDGHNERTGEDIEIHSEEIPPEISEESKKNEDNVAVDIPKEETNEIIKENPTIEHENIQQYTQIEQPQTIEETTNEELPSENVHHIDIAPKSFENIIEAQTNRAASVEISVENIKLTKPELSSTIPDEKSEGDEDINKPVCGSPVAKQLGLNNQDSEEEEINSLEMSKDEELLEMEVHDENLEYELAENQTNEQSENIENDSNDELEVIQKTQSFDSSESKQETQISEAPEEENLNSTLEDEEFPETQQFEEDIQDNLKANGEPVNSSDILEPKSILPLDDGHNERVLEGVEVHSEEKSPEIPENLKLIEDNPAEEIPQEESNEIIEETPTIEPENIPQDTQIEQPQKIEESTNEELPSENVHHIDIASKSIENTKPELPLNIPEEEISGSDEDINEPVCGSPVANLEEEEINSLEMTKGDEQLEMEVHDENLENELAENQTNEQSKNIENDSNDEPEVIQKTQSFDSSESKQETQTSEAPEEENPNSTLEDEEFPETQQLEEDIQDDSKVNGEPVINSDILEPKSILPLDDGHNERVEEDVEVHSKENSPEIPEKLKQLEDNAAEEIPKEESIEIIEESTTIEHENIPQDTQIEQPQTIEESKKNEELPSDKEHQIVPKSFENIIEAQTPSKRRAKKLNYHELASGSPARTPRRLRATSAEKSVENSKSTKPEFPSTIQEEEKLENAPDPTETIAENSQPVQVKQKLSGRGRKMDKIEELKSNVEDVPTPSKRAKRGVTPIKPVVTEPEKKGRKRQEKVEVEKPDIESDAKITDTITISSTEEEAPKLVAKRGRARQAKVDEPINNDEQQTEVRETPVKKGRGRRLEKEEVLKEKDEEILPEKVDKSPKRGRGRKAVEEISQEKHIEETVQESPVAKKSRKRQQDKIVELPKDPEVNQVEEKIASPEPPAKKRGRAPKKVETHHEIPDIVFEKPAEKPKRGRKAKIDVIPEVVESISEQIENVTPQEKIEEPGPSKRGRKLKETTPDIQEEVPKNVETAPKRGRKARIEHVQEMPEVHKEEIATPKRGRKAKLDVISENKEPEPQIQEVAKKGRGRKNKVEEVEPEIMVISSQSTQEKASTVAPTKRGRGRQAKTVTEPEAKTDEEKQEIEQPTTSKRGRGQRKEVVTEAAPEQPIKIARGRQAKEPEEVSNVQEIENSPKKAKTPLKRKIAKQVTIVTPSSSMSTHSKENNDESVVTKRATKRQAQTVEKTAAAKRPTRTRK